MFRKFLILLLAFVLAWFFGPLLSGLVGEISSGIPGKEAAAGKVVDYVTGRGGDAYVHILLWTVIFCLLLPLFAFLFGFLAPQARRYATTKLLRRIHGVTAELMILGVTFIVLTMALSFTPPAEKRVKEPITQALLSFKVGFSFSNPTTLSNLNAIRFDHAAPFAKAVTDNATALTNYLRELARASVLIRPEYYDPEHNHYDAIARAIENVSWLRPLPPPAHYRDIQSQHWLLKLDYKHAQELVELKSQVKPGGEIYVEAQTEVARALAEINFWQRRFLVPVQYIWPPALGLSCLLWFLAHVLFKSEISAIHRVFMRFIDEGRFGQGGSGRFAGLFEEWGVLSGYTDPGAIVSMILSPIGKEHVGQRFGEWLAKKRRTPAVISRQELFMGRSLYNPFLHIGLSDDRHMLTIAPSRTGKGATAIIPNLLLWEGSAIVIDPKGTNAAVTAQRRRDMGQKVHLVDPFGIVEKNEELRACFNPLENLDLKSDTIREDIGVIADALVVPDPEAKEKHWDDGARTVLSGLIGQLVTDAAFEKPSLPMLRELLALHGDKQDELWANMYLNPGAGESPRDAASRIIRGAGTNEISGLISNADKHTEWLSSPTMRKTLSKSTFSFADVKEQPTTIYLILPPKLLATHNRFLRLFINMAILQMSVGGKSKIPVLMVLDEFLALGHMAEVEKALGLMAGYNLVLWPIVQDLARLNDLYKNSVHSFIANSRAVQVFGVSDPTTTEYISKQLGNSAASVLPTGKFSTFVPLRSPDEVAKDVERESNRQYILRAGKAPLVLEKVAYHQGGLFGGAYPGLFHGKYAADPDHS